MQQVAMSFTFTVFGALTIINGVPTQATQNQPITPFQFTAAGGTTPYTWSATGLPDGLSLSSSGLLTGTPVTAGTFNITITVSDAS